MRRSRSIRRPLSHHVGAGMCAKGLLLLTIIACAWHSKAFTQSTRHRTTPHAVPTIPTRRSRSLGNVYYGRRYTVLNVKDSQCSEDKQNASDGNWIHARAKSCKRLILRTQSWVVQTIQRLKSRNFIVAAAFALSVLFCSQQHVSHYVGNAGGPERPEINVIHRSCQDVNLGTRPNLNAVHGTDSEVVDVVHSGGLNEIRGGESIVPSMETGAPRKGLSRLAKDQKSLEEAMVTAAGSTSRTLTEALLELRSYMAGPKSDTLILLLATALITPLCKRLGTSPILGFLTSGMLLGPNGCGFISGIHTTETLAELGIVFFLFEMGIELSFERLLSMRRDVFGLGLSQFVGSALAVAAAGRLMGLPANALVVLGGGIALSSSAFVLQLLKDKNQLATRFGKASFGVLLFQDLAVVPLLVVTPILAGGGGGLAAALGSAVLKAAIALGSITLLGRYLLNPFFKMVAQAQSQEAFLGLILLTVLSMSFMTEGLGLSNTLGAFLAGVLLSETKYRYQVEADIAPFRGVLLGLFFVTVGFEIDVNLVASNLPVVSSVVLGIIAIKAVITTVLSLLFGLSLSVSQQTGLILSQGGEFAFVSMGLARSLGILDRDLTKLMLTSVSLTMALTPALSALGGKIAKQLEENSDFTHYLGQDRDANEIKESDDFAVVIGYGAVGKVVCDLLDRKLIKYVGIDLDPNKAIQARNSGLPVFYGDIGRQEVAEAFNVGKAKAVVVCISEKAQANRAVIALRRWYPDVKIFCRARDKDHAFRLQSTLDVAAMVPILPEDNLLLTLPFGGAVLKALGSPPEEVNAILETKRKEVLSGRGLEENEETLALLQLGIDTEDTKKKDSVKVASNGTELEESFVEEESMSAAAAERVEATKEKSPFVAQVIGEVCPDSVVEAEAVDVPETDLLIEVASNIEPGAIDVTPSNATSPTPPVKYPDGDD